ncbi:MAG: NAD(P)-dependent oxidoreductase, partial [Bacteroidetes bacterium]
YFSITGNTSRKSVVCDIDVARLIPELQNNHGEYNLTDGNSPRFVEIEEAVSKSLGKRIPFRLPIRVVRLLGKVGDLFLRLNFGLPLTSNSVSKMTATLTFSSKKAKQELAWDPQDALEYIRSDFKETKT